jgi:hypothetical protein
MQKLIKCALILLASNLGYIDTISPALTRLSNLVLELGVCYDYS